MKRSKILLSITLVAAVILLACESPEMEPGPNLTTQHQIISLTGTIHFLNSEMNPNQFGMQEFKRSTFQGIGNCNAKFLSDVELSLSHIVVLDPKMNDVQFVNGEFKLYGEGCHLYGSYEGRNVNEVEGSPIDLVMEIKGGGGFYEGASGQIRGWWAQSSAASEEYSMGIRGIIRKPMLVAAY